MEIINFDTINYDGDTYEINCFPLQTFLNNTNHQKKIRDTYKSWRGYNCLWKIEKNKLFVEEIESDILDIEELFHDKNALFANWYTGVIILYKGYVDLENHYINSFIKYKYCYGLKIINGTIVDTQNVLIPVNPEKFIAGKYAGLSLAEILSNDEVIEDYLHEIFLYLFCNKYPYSILLPSIKFDQPDFELLEKIRGEKGIEISIDCHQRVWMNNLNNISSKEIINLLSKVFSSDFENVKYYNRSEFTLAESSLASTLLNFSLEYLEWAMMHKPKFFIPPQKMNSDIWYSKLKFFELSLKDQSHLISYKLDRIGFCFTQTLKNVNLKKYQNFHDLKFSKTFNNLLCSISHEEIISMNSYFDYKIDYIGYSHYSDFHNQEREDYDIWENYTWKDSASDAYGINFEDDDFS